MRKICRMKLEFYKGIMMYFLGGIKGNFGEDVKHNCPGSWHTKLIERFKAIHACIGGIDINEKKELVAKIETTILTICCHVNF